MIVYYSVLFHKKRNKKDRSSCRQKSYDPLKLAQIACNIHFQVSLFELFLPCLVVTEIVQIKDSVEKRYTYNVWSTNNKFRGREEKCEAVLIETVSCVHVLSITILYPRMIGVPFISGHDSFFCRHVNFF